MKYLVGAYILIWLLLMGYTLYLSGRQNKLRKSVEFLKSLIEKKEK
jgi:CcmD family protein